MTAPVPSHALQRFWREWNENVAGCGSGYAWPHGWQKFRME